MFSNSHLSADWTVVTNPEDLRKLYEGIASGRSNLSLLVVGPTSTGKTELARQVFDLVRPEQEDKPRDLNRAALILEGGATPIELYIQAYKNQGRTLIIDDPAPDFLKRSDGQRLWKQMFATERRRWLTWRTKTDKLDKEEVDRAFNTTSKFVCICNDMQVSGPHIEAVLARATCVYYNPDLMTRMKYAESWVQDKELIKYLWDQYRAGALKRLHQRHVYMALEYKRNQLQDWKAYIARVTSVEELEENPQVQDAAYRLVRWAGENTECGVFAKYRPRQVIRLFKDDASFYEEVLQYAEQHHLLHRVPVRRIKGDKTRLPSEVYCVGAGDPKRSGMPHLKVRSRGVKSKAKPRTSSKSRSRLYPLKVTG